MVSATLADTLHNPTAALVALWNTSPDLHEFPGIVDKHFRAIFSTSEAFQQIPTLNLDHPPWAQLQNKRRPLVRFRGMVQDTAGSHEVYRGILPGNSLGGWGLAEEYEGEDDGSGYLDYVMEEKTSLWTVSVPGETEWIAQAVNDDDPTPVVNNERDISERHSAQPHKYPFPKENHLGIQVFIYGSSIGTLKPTDVVTFVGILSESCYMHSDPAEAEILVPALHVLFVETKPPSALDCPYPMELLTSPVPPTNAEDIDPPQTVGGSSAFEEIRFELIDWLATEALAGDRDAAEWVLLTVVGRVHSRTPAILPPSLALTTFPAPPLIPSPSPSSNIPALEPTIKHALALILPSLVHVPLSIPYLNETAFFPISKEEDLFSGVLQLPEGTTVIVSDEAVLEGTLNNMGVLNVRALKECVSTQTLTYTFPYHPLFFPANLNFLVLTQGKKSVFVDTDITIPIKSTPESWSTLYKAADQIKIPSQEKLDAFRAFIGGAKKGKVFVEEDVSQYIQNDFVAERQQAKGVTSEDLVLRMALARLMAVTLHETKVTKDIWERVKSLDTKRKARML